MFTRKLLTLLFLLAITINGQSVVEPLNRNVYSFLSRMDEKGLIDFNDVVKPVTRGKIAAYLKVIESNYSKLSSIEIEELSWYKNEYFKEITDEKNLQPELKKTILGDSHRYRLFYYDDEKFSFAFSPVIRLEQTSVAKENLFSKRWGFSFFGSVGNNFGFRGDFLENSVKGKNHFLKDKYNIHQGEIIAKSKNDEIEFSKTNGSMTYVNDWLTISALKEDINIGSGYRSQIILSSKAPSFPSINYVLEPVDWFKFYFIHGWLFSGVKDSAASYITNFKNNIRWVEREKYFVMHALQVNPLHGLSVTLGETIIYSDRNIYWGYFIPFLFFRSVDHMFTYGSGDSGNNGSFFLDVSHKPFNKFKYYLSLFIDELSLTRLLKGDPDRNQFGYTVGFSTYGFPFDNFGIKTEYTRVLPWVYSNWISSQTYTNSNYLLGHYIGQNADQLFLQLDYRLLRGLELKLWGEYIRRGGFDEVNKQYTDPGEPFLYGLRRNETNLGFEVSYEYIHDLFVKGFYQYSNVSDEDVKRTPAFMLGVNNSFGISLGYGL